MSSGIVSGGVLLRASAVQSPDHFRATTYAGDPTQTFGGGKHFVNAGPRDYKKYKPRLYESGIVSLLPINYVPTHALERAIHCDPGQLGADLLMVENKFPSANPEDDVAVVESEDGMLRIVAPEFKSTAVMRFTDLSLPENRAWTVGFITACLDYELCATYADGGVLTYSLPQYGARVVHVGAGSGFKSGSRAGCGGGEGAVGAPFGGGRSGANLEREWQRALHCDTIVEFAATRRSPPVPIDFYNGIEHLRPAGLPPGCDGSQLRSVAWRQIYRTWLGAVLNTTGTVYALMPVRWTIDIEYDAAEQRFSRVHAQYEHEGDNYFVPEAAVDPCAEALSEQSLRRQRTNPTWLHSLVDTPADGQHDS